MGDKHAWDDRKMVEACIRKDPGAWDLFLSKYSRLIYIAIEKRLKKYGIILQPHDIEDIRQNVLSGIWKKDRLKDVAQKDNISFWLAMVAGNAAITYARKPEIRDSARFLSLDEKTDRDRIGDLLIKDIGLSGKGILSQDMNGQINIAIESLPAKEKIIVKLALLYEKKQREISDMLNIPEGTVSSCIKRAKEKMRKKLKRLEI